MRGLNQTSTIFGVLNEIKGDIHSKTVILVSYELETAFLQGDELCLSFIVSEVHITTFQFLALQKISKKTFHHMFQKIPNHCSVR